MRLLRLVLLLALLFVTAGCELFHRHLAATTPRDVEPVSQHG